MQALRAISIGNYQLFKDQIIGKGATGNVYKGKSIKTGQNVAIKAIEMSQVNNQVTQYLLDAQKQATTEIKNKYVVNTYDIIQEKDYCYIVMQQCTGGTLKDYIQTKGCLQQTQAIQIFRNILVGYIAINDKLFIHRDLKTANVMLKENKQPAIIDFGYAEVIMGKRPIIYYNVGTPAYMSPQAKNKSLYSQKSDVWALGIILYEMLTGKTLDYNRNIKQYFEQLNNLKVAKYNIPNCSQLVRDLLDNALVVALQNRATCMRLKYLIDKAMIPKIQTQKVQGLSQNNSPTRFFFKESSIKGSQGSPIKIQRPTYSDYDSISSPLKKPQTIKNNENSFAINLIPEQEPVLRKGFSEIVKQKAFGSSRNIYQPSDIKQFNTTRIPVNCYKPPGHINFNNNFTQQQHNNTINKSEKRKVSMTYTNIPSTPIGEQKKMKLLKTQSYKPNDYQSNLGKKSIRFNGFI